jgi:flavin reductase (DIM6/NTAB) family NADH-FMN oxidoreductase RutF
MTRSALLLSDPPSACPDEVQDAVSSFPSGVTVVTTAADGEPYGMTVSAFTALSQAPPLVLVCVASGSRGIDLLARSGAFCVNVLAASQGPLARRFASRRRPRGAAMFDGIPHRTGVTGSPVLLGTVSHLECELHRLDAGGDHTVVLGRVLRAATVPDEQPLVVHRRALSTVEHVSGALPPALAVVRP